MVSCASCGYALTKKNKTLKVTFHSFPKDATRRQLWINFLRKSDWMPKPSSVLCSQHFTEECFDRTSQLKVRLQTNAVPTIEVNRLKYVRNYNPIFTRTIEEHELAEFQKNSEIIIIKDAPSVSEGIVQNGRSTATHSLTRDDLLEDIPRKRKLKRQICELQQKDSLKNRKIRKLQKIVWRQKKQIMSLKSMTIELKKRISYSQNKKTMYGNILDQIK